MSMQLSVLSDRQVASMADWQAAIDRAGFPLALALDKPFERLGGFLPGRLSGDPTGFECYHENSEELQADFADVPFNHAWRYALVLRWGGDLKSLRSAWMAATGYAIVTDGVVFDDQEAVIRTAAEARETVAAIERDWPRAQSLMPRQE